MVSLDEARRLLREHDDTENCEVLGGWGAYDYPAAEQRFRTFAADVERRLGQSCVIESGSSIQDASFVGQVFLPPACVIAQEGLAVRVSHFGDFVTLTGGDEGVDVRCLNEIQEAIRQSGLTYIPPAILAEPYDGVNPYIEGNWRTRFFDWI